MQLLTRSLKYTTWSRLSASILGVNNHQSLPGSSSNRGFQSKVAKNYYDVLEVTPHASLAQVKAAYYRLSKKFHPDLNKSTGAQERFAEISEAYEVLGNAGNRRQYDDGTLNPLDIGAGHHGKVDIEYQEFLKKTGFKVKKQPPRGRSHIYNFDEFYRAHYDEVRSMQFSTGHESKRKFEAFSESQERTDRELKLMARVVQGAAVILLLNVAGTFAYRLYSGTLF